MNGFIWVRGLLFWMAIISLPTLVSGREPYSEVYVQGHRCLVIEPAGLSSDTPVVLILHGFGTNGFEMLPLCHELNLPSCIFVLPDAPLQVPHSSSEAHAWYDRYTHSYTDMLYSRDYLFALMDHFSKETLDPSDSDTLQKPRPVIIMGFSQGAVMSLEAGLNYKGNLEAIVSMSGFIEYPEKTLAHPMAPRQTPILLVGGEWDPVIQEEDTQATMAALKRSGYHPVLREFLMGHKITFNTINATSTFLQGILNHDH